MANWSKRRTIYGGKKGGSRTTRTTSSSGRSTTSTSKRIGNTRYTETIRSDGSIRRTKTEHHPILGTRRTSETVTKKTQKPKKHKSSSKRPRRSNKYTSSTVRIPATDHQYMAWWKQLLITLFLSFLAILIWS